MKLWCKLRQAGVWQRSTGPLHGSGFESSKVFLYGKRQELRTIPAFGRSGGIRTRGLLDPNQARYQASPHPDSLAIILNYWQCVKSSDRKLRGRKIWGSLRKTAGGCVIRRGGGMFLDDLARLCYNRIGSRHLSRRCPAARDGRQIGEK